MTKQYWTYLTTVRDTITQQSEDCLYLNIYAPEMKNSVSTSRMPVIVFIHGESYEWNSGNPYDGSVLASYGQVRILSSDWLIDSDSIF